MLSLADRLNLTNQLRQVLTAIKVFEGNQIPLRDVYSLENQDPGLCDPLAYERLEMSRQHPSNALATNWLRPGLLVPLPTLGSPQPTLGTPLPPDANVNANESGPW